MLNVETREKIRQAYYLEHKSMRQIAREQNHSRKTIKKALASSEVTDYQLSNPRQAPVLGPYKERIESLLKENEGLPRKQRYTIRRIYETLRAEGYEGCESGVGHYVSQWRKARCKRKVYLPLAYEPGMDAQVDWGEAEIIFTGERRTVQFFVMRMCYSRKLFVRAYPSQAQECFFDAHVTALHYYGGVPHRLIYDNLKTAVYTILSGKDRLEQEQFIAFRSHYLFESRYCNPGQGHEKGGVEHGVGFARRNFMVPLPEVDSFEELNVYLLDCCQADDARQVHGQAQTIAQMWQEEQGHLRPLPAHDFICAKSREVALNPYSQVVFETNRYSVPTEYAYPKLLLRAYPFRIEILYKEESIAQHCRSYGRDQDIIDPIHYLNLLEQRPGAFEHAQPIRQWREQWAPVYEELLAHLQQDYESSQAIRHFIQILKLHKDYPADDVAQAVKQALSYKRAHPDGVILCLKQRLQHEHSPSPLDLKQHPHLAQIGQQSLDLQQYDRLLGGDHHVH